MKNSGGVGTNQEEQTNTVERDDSGKVVRTVKHAGKRHTAQHPPDRDSVTTPNRSPAVSR